MNFQLIALIVFTLILIVMGILWSRPDARDWVGLWDWRALALYALLALALWIIYFWKL